MEDKKYVIYDKTKNRYVSYLMGMATCHYFTDIKRCANRYTFKQALFDKEWISKVCHIKPEDLVIMEI